MTGGLTKRVTEPAIIQKARVLDVDISNYTLVVATEFTKKPLANISFATPYQHFVNGEGIYFMPEVGCVVWLCEPSDGSMPFVLAWAAGQDEGDYRARKQDLNPGDIYLGTRDDNFLILRRGGVVQVGSGPLAQRIFLPVNNTIRDFCENYALHSLGGDLEWSVGRSDTDTDGKRPCLLKLSARVKADDAAPTAVLQIGSHDNDPDTILDLIINASGAQGAQQQISLKLDDKGNVTWTIQKDFTYTVQGKYNVTAQGDVTLASQGNFTASGQQGATVSTPQTATVKGGIGVTLDAPQTQTTGLLMVGGGGQPLALAPALLIWAAAHVHNIILPVPGTPTSPPITPPPPTIASVKAQSVA